MKRVTLVAALLMGASAVFAQTVSKEDYNSTILLNPDVIVGTFLGETPRLDSFVPDPNENMDTVKGENLGYDAKDDWLLNTHDYPNVLPDGPDPLLQRDYNHGTTRALTQSFDGMGYNGVNPADPSIDVGPNHVIQMINGPSGAYYQIYDKTGTILVAQTYFDLLPGIGNGLGDPIVLYDEVADRWLMSEFSSGGNTLYVAISTTADPTGTWYAYSYNTPNFPDYPKYSVWNNAYIITTNENPGGSGVYALDRTSMLTGTAGTAQRFTVPNFGTIGFQATTPVSLNGTTAPPAGAPAMVMRMRDDAWAGAASDALEIWEFDIDWAIPANTTLTQTDVLAVSAFSSELCGYTSFSCIDQPGGGSADLDPLRELLMNRIHYRNFGTHESIVCSHVVDVSGVVPGTDQAGVRWYELRRTGGVGGTWAIYQEGTYSPDGDSRWMSSIGISASGNIGLAYNVSSTSTFPSLRYTGRQECDPLGVMTVTETVIVAGSGSNGSNRYGDYNAMGLDPSDGETFWFTGKYNTSSQWSTRIGAFDIPVCISSPTTQFTTSTFTVNEPDANVPNGCLDYWIQDVELCIGIDPSQPADITINVAGGTATQGVDYDIFNTTFTLDGATLCGTAEVWIYNDDYVEGTETIDLDYTLNPNGGDATTGAVNQTVTITINDDDADPLSALGPVVTIHTQDFESGFGGYTSFNPVAASPPGDQWQLGTNATVPNGAYAIPGTNPSTFAWLDDDDCDCNMNQVDLIFPSLDLSSYFSAQLDFISYYEDNNWAGDQENADVMVSVSGGPYTFVADLVASSIDVDWTAQSFDVSAYTGAGFNDVVFAIRYSDAGGWLYGCAVDDIVITGQGPIAVQTVVNVGLGDQANLGPNETVHFYDPTTGNVMITLDNTSAWDYGCVDVEVDRQGTGASIFHSVAAPDLLADKSYTVVPSNNNPTGTFDITVYYEEAEVAGWEAATGNSRANMEIIKVAGNNAISDVNPGNYTTFTIDNVVAAMGSFFSDVTFTSGFTNGFSGFGIGIYNTTAVTHTTVNTDPTCNGDSDGSIVITASNGITPYQYSIDNGATWQASNTFSGLPAGTYNVIVEDALGSQSTMSVEVLSDPSAVTYTDSSSDPSCSGGSDGTITLTGAGGDGGPYQYSIDNGVTFQASGSFTGLGAGTYNIVVEDASGCQGTGTIPLTDPTPVTIDNVVATDPTCNGGSDGSLVITASGGTTPYQYSNDNGVTFQASNTFNGLGAGTYDIVVEDANGCQATTPGTLTDPPVVTYSASITDENCGAGDGQIVLTGAGGDGGPYQYSIDNGVTFQASGTFSGLSAGSFNIVVEDASGCQATGTEIVGNIGGPSISSLTSTDPVCNGDANGTITITATGGATPYQYSIDNGVTFQASGSFTGLGAGTYDIVVEDAGGCQSTGSVTLTNPPVVTYTSSTTDETCGSANGSITLTGAGGDGGPYQYSIDNGVTFQASGNFTGLTTGTYDVVVEDASGCQATGTVNVGSTGGASITAVNTTDPTCNGANDGIITITASGGTPTIMYSIDGGATFQAGAMFTGLTPGTYDVMIEDGAGCQTSFGTVTLTDPAVITVSATSTNENCGASDGTITVTASGGTGSLTYSIGGSFQASNTFIGLTANTYTITVEDANGCQATTTETVGSTGGASITAVNTTEPTCNGGTDGSITITASGGTPAITYSIDGGSTFQASNTFTGLGAGTYDIVVEDGSGCQTSFGTVTITDPTAVSFTSSSTGENCGAADGSITLTGSGGTGALQYSIDGGTTFQSSGSFGGLTTGTYSIVVEDANGCQATGSVSVTSIGGPAITVTTTDPLCNGDLNGDITILAAGGSTPYQYSIDGGSIFQASNSFTGLGAGTYAIQVDDAGGCSGTTTVTLTEPAALSNTMTEVGATCGMDNGVAIADIQGGTQPYTYSWNDPAGQTASAATGLAGGTYTIDVMDANGCTFSDVAVITETDSLHITVDVSHESCYGSADGSIYTAVSGGVSPYTYAWDSGDSTGIIYGLTAGDYTVVIRDANGCMVTELIPIFTENADCIVIPTAISPNGDGSNDVWVIQGLEEYPDAVVEVYNRWGSPLFNESDYQNDWDGTYNGNDLPAGVYYYVVALDEDAEAYTGTITILR